MTTRRDAREWALQILFEVDMNPPDELQHVLAEFWREKEVQDKQREFTERLVSGVLTNRDALDASLVKYAENWDLKRMGVVERNVMRMALFELFHCEDIPPVVTINEAVDVAKYFSTSESGRFVNGILDRVRKTLKRPLREGVKGKDDDRKGPKAR